MDENCKCPACGWEGTWADTEEKCDYPGSYYEPAEYRYLCPLCGQEVEEVELEEEEE